MAVQRKKKAKKVEKLERRDRAFATFITILVLLAVVAPIVLLIFNPFGWNLTGESTPSTPDTTEPTSKNRTSVIEPKAIIKSDSAINEVGGYQQFIVDSFTDTYGYTFRFGVATDSAASVSIGAVSNPKYIFRVTDNEDTYNIQIALQSLDNKVNLTSLTVTPSVKNQKVLASGSDSLAYIYEDLIGTNEIASISFTYTIK